MKWKAKEEEVVVVQRVELRNPCTAIFAAATISNSSIINFHHTFLI
jgi:hypothetical protein